MTIEIQFVSLFSMLLTGIYLGCMFDTNERINRYFEAKRIMSFLFQFIFWLIQSVLIFLFLIKINGGHVRLYFVLAIIFGYWVYFLKLRGIYQNILEKLLAVLSKILLTLMRLFTLLFVTPVIFVIQTFFYLIKLAIIVIFRILYFFLTLIEWILKPVLMIMPKNVKKYLVSFTKMYSKIVDRLRNVK